MRKSFEEKRPFKLDNPLPIPNKETPINLKKNDENKQVSFTIPENSLQLKQVRFILIISKGYFFNNHSIFSIYSFINNLAR